MTVGHQMKYSNMVKGRSHDQSFDETLEFVLAAGEAFLHFFFCFCVCFGIFALDSFTLVCFHPPFHPLPALYGYCRDAWLAVTWQVFLIMLLFESTALLQGSERQYQVCPFCCICPQHLHIAQFVHLSCSIILPTLEC